MNSSELIKLASNARNNAYAKYSGYTVGAAVLDSSGRVYVGANVENISYGLTLCAERVAIARMVIEGGREIETLVVATKDGGTPCGMCLQTIAEFVPQKGDTEIILVDERGDCKTFKFKDLLPHQFTSTEVQ